MAEYVWWFLIVGLVAGGGLVAFFMADVARRDEDLDAAEGEAEGSLIAAQLAADGRPVDRRTVAAVLRAHRQYRRLPPPDRLTPVGGPIADDAAATSAKAAEEDDADDDGLAGLARPRLTSARDGNADREPDEVGHGGRRRADEDLPPA
jgi:hypothetical protein